MVTNLTPGPAHQSDLGPSIDPTGNADRLSQRRRHRRHGRHLAHATGHRDLRHDHLRSAATDSAADLFARRAPDRLRARSRSRRRASETDLMHRQPPTAPACASVTTQPGPTSTRSMPEFSPDGTRHRVQRLRQALSGRLAGGIGGRRLGAGRRSAFPRCSPRDEGGAVYLARRASALLSAAGPMDQLFVAAADGIERAQPRHRPGPNEAVERRRGPPRRQPASSGTTTVATSS